MGDSDVYSEYLEDHDSGTSLPNMLTNGERSSAITSGNLHLTAPNVVDTYGDHMLIYSPNPAEEGSSISHNHYLASVIRDSELSCEVYLADKKLGNQFNFAEKKGIAFAILCGADEKTSDTVTLKNMATRENLTKISLLEAIRKIKDFTEQ